MEPQERPPLTLRFQAMGCPCEILLDTTDESLARLQLAVAQQEAERIENQYSRYRAGNIVDQINTSAGRKIDVDEETAALLDYAGECYRLSEGLFDITTGVLRKKEANPSLIGWDKVLWKSPTIQLPSGFEIDLGGICKEYAADRILSLMRKHDDLSLLVNLGGDIAAAGTRLWSVGIEDVTKPGSVVHTVHLRQGGIATSGTTKRGKHILHPKSGEPVSEAPQSITVAARTCTEAGFWSTLAMLQGRKAEAFLEEQGLEFWCYRSEEKEGLSK